MNNINLGRDKLPWSEEVWNRIDEAVHAECQRIKIAQKFLPTYGPVPEALTQPADKIITNGGSLFIDEAEVTPLIEIWSNFTLTKEQVNREEELMTASTLATRTAQLVSRAQDLIVFQGQAAIENDPLFTEGKVRFRSGPAGTGLINTPLSDDQIIPVPAIDPNQLRFGEHTFEAIAEGYARLEGIGHSGPFALILPTIPYADTYAPLANTLIMPADRIKPLVSEGFYGTGTLPKFTGVLVSLGGNSMDLVIGKDAVTAFMQEDPDGNYLFRVYQRFALRLKDPTARILFEFSIGAQETVQQKRKTAAGTVS